MLQFKQVQKCTHTNYFGPALLMTKLFILLGRIRQLFSRISNGSQIKTLYKIALCRIRKSVFYFSQLIQPLNSRLALKCVQSELLTASLNKQ